MKHTKQVLSDKDIQALFILCVPQQRQNNNKVRQLYKDLYTYMNDNDCESCIVPN